MLSAQRLCPPRVIVIMAEFTDTHFRDASTASSFSDFFNSANYTYEGATGSVQQYFNDQSFGQYIPVFDVVGPVALSHNRAYYGENDDYNDDMRADEMVAEACNLAENLTDFTRYDSDGDGNVDAVVVLFAGVGEVYGVSDADAVWAYSGNLENSEELDYSVVCDNKTITYFCAVPEMETSTYRAGIGTVVHEFAHILGLPNLCVTDGGTQKTLGDWDVMDHGSYNNRSRTPAAFSAYERFYMGWLEPILLDEAMNVRLRELNISGDCGIITASGQHNLSGVSPDPREFYTVENRQQTGWDKYIPGHGMMLTKIDFVRNKWEDDIVNNVERHPCVDIIEADGSRPSYKADNLTNGYFGKQGDLFPSGASEYKMFSNKMYFSGVTEQDELIRFDFLGGVSKCEVTFYVGNGGSCATTSLTESTKGAGVILPAVTAQSGYTFLGWSTRKNSAKADAGQAGDRYYPMSDCTLFAVMQDNTRYYADYNLKGVTIGDYIGFNGAYVKTSAITDIGVTFIKKAGYATPTMDNCLVRVECGGKQLSDAYTFDADTIRVNVPASAITGNIYFTVVNVREQGDSGCDDYTHTFTSKCYVGEAQDFSGYDWNVTITNSTTLDYEKNKGAVFGSNTYPAELVRFYTEETMGCGVKRVTVTASAGSSSDAELRVFLAGSQIGETQDLTTTSTTYTFEVTEPQSGGVDIRLTNTMKAVYVKQITIEYELLDDGNVPLNVTIPSSTNEERGRLILRNGQLLIIHNGNIYNILGTKLK